MAAIAETCSRLAVSMTIVYSPIQLSGVQKLTVAVTVGLFVTETAHWTYIKHSNVYQLMFQFPSIRSPFVSALVLILSSARTVATTFKFLSPLFVWLIISSQSTCLLLGAFS
jgi:hypothetical protein